MGKLYDDYFGQVRAQRPAVTKNVTEIVTKPPASRKRGRPKKAHAMTAAERQRKARAARKAHLDEIPDTDQTGTHRRQ